jgi:hypothetical protein
MKFPAFAAIAAAGLALSGCATMVTGSSEDIAVLTPPVSGATCVLSNAAGSWTVVTPTVAHVQRSKTDMRITCTKPGYRDADAALPSHLEGLTIGNVATLGLGVGVDAYTGAINQYPHSIQIPMQPSTTAAQAPEPAPSTPGTTPSS